MAIKKATVKKQGTRDKGQGTGGGKTTILRWLFAPDTAQGWKGWLLRAAGFLAVFVAFMAVVGIIGINVQMALANLPQISTEVALAVLWESVVENWPAWLGAIAMIYAVGMFAMMPRRALDRRGFAAVFFFFVFWMSFAGGAAWCINEYAGDTSWAWPFAVIVLVAAIGMMASLARFSRAVGASKWQAFLMFPFGYSLFQYAALFTPAAEGNKTIALKSKWFPRVRDFLLDDVRGQAALALIIAALAVAGSSWDLFLIAFFAVVYFWRGGAAVAAYLPKLAWVAVLFNLAVSGFMAYAFGMMAIL